MKRFRMMGLGLVAALLASAEERLGRPATISMVDLFDDARGRQVSSRSASRVIYVT